MRLRATTAWAVTVLLASVGCARTDGGSASEPGTGTGAAGADDGPAPMALDFVRGGSRLAAMGYSSDDAQAFATFHDRQLDFDCEFVSATGTDEQRCVPRALVRVVYTDADCSEPAGWLQRSAGAQSGTAVSSAPPESTTNCPGQLPPHRDAYRVGELIFEESVENLDVPLFERGASGCHTATPPGKLAPDTYRLTPLPERELVRGERASIDLGSGLRLTRLIADDGAALNLGATTSDGTPCELQRDGECVPEPIARPSFDNSGKFSTALNADCSVPAFEAPYWANCGDPRYGVQDDGTHPPRVHEVEKVSAYFSWQITLPVTDPISYSCLSFDASGVVAPAAPVREVTGTLPSADQQRRGTGPLHVDWYVRGQSQLLPVLADFRRASPGVVPAPAFVNDAGVPCEIRPATDGSEHCAVVDPAGQVGGEIDSYPVVRWGEL